LDGTVANQWHVGEKPLTVGRGQDADAKVNDAEMSRKHFVITAKKGAFIIEDLESKNGTKLNGQRITKAAIKVKDQIAAGESRFILEDDIPIVEMPTITGQHKPKGLKRD
jgi:pSer/pThr/pTyr-binding forkhead associated (FHA) protein